MLEIYNGWKWVDLGIFNNLEDCLNKKQREDANHKKYKKTILKF